ncbi:hypothetical protein ORN01_25065 [Bacillus cereus]|uniref:hypothetical protein n=1 Tax=Bacillus cereus group TaxID=86661 RepID=UPI0022E7F724|nr:MULTISPECIES: hypothetical protein [Bacillus cereus group]MDA1509650.1 hypothetical protein [Bacillus cereus group sp. TH36-2LC]MDZ4632229.1 hypothetical protein [Bacillus cereus]
MNAERMKNQTNKQVDMDKLALDIIKGNYQVVATEQSRSLECMDRFEADIVLPDGITLTVKREGWGF